MGIYFEIEIITGYYGRLCILIRGKITDPSFNFLFNKTTTICETIEFFLIFFHSSRSAIIVLEQNKFSKKITSDRD